MCVCVRVCRQCPETHFSLLFLKQTLQIGRCCGPQLCSCSTMALTQPASATARCKKLLPSKLVPCCSNQPHCSCHGKQARRALSATAFASSPCRRCFKVATALLLKKKPQMTPLPTTPISPSLLDSSGSSQGSAAAADLCVLVTHR